MHKEQLNKLTDTIKENQKYVNTFTGPLVVDKEETKEANPVKTLKENEFV